MKENEINLIIKQEKSKENIDTKKISDTHHTFGELYEHRIVLFAALCNKYSDLSWKSKKHYDGKMILCIKILLLQVLILHLE